ncbi:hypothetical protein Saa2_03198 [Streptomyces acidiscabies]|nr:hypothetical protein Saa2_03198 [Streptomyces acidiscabies]
MRGQGWAGFCDRRGDAGGREGRAGAGQFGREAALPVAGDRLADLRQGLAAHRLDVRDLDQGRVQVPGCQAAGGLRLHDDHREGVAQQVVQVTGEAEPLLLHRAPGEFLAGGAQFPDRVREGEDSRRHQRRDPGRVRRVEAVPALVHHPDRAGEGRQGEAHPAQVRHPDHRARREAEQREEQQPGAAVPQGQRAGDQGQCRERRPCRRRLPGLPEEGVEDDVDIERVEGEQPQTADHRVRGLGLEEVGEGAESDQQPGQHAEAAEREVLGLPGSPCPAFPVHPASPPSGHVLRRRLL